MKRVLTALVCLAVVVGGLLSLFASANPDGLEWAIERVTGAAELEAGGGVFDAFASVQEAFAFLPDYSFPSSESAAGTSVSGIVGGILTCALAGLAGLLISLFKKSRRREA
jgi:cobalt/nickel transport system permease protein